MIFVQERPCLPVRILSLFLDRSFVAEVPIPPLVFLGRVSKHAVLFLVGEIMAGRRLK